MPPRSDYHAMRLAIRINTALMKLYRLTQQVTLLEQRIASDLGSYYSALSQSIASPYQSTTHIAPAKADYIAPLEQFMQRLYHTLARQCHPDVNQQPAVTMSDINHAYDNRQLGSLMALSNQLQANTDRPHDLRQHYQHITSLNQEMQRHLESLEQSDANQLCQKLRHARFTGENIIGEVAFHLKRKLQQEIYAA